MAQISFEACEKESSYTMVHGYVRDWYLISGEGDCGEGDCGEGDCGEGDCGEGEW